MIRWTVEVDTEQSRAIDEIVWVSADLINAWALVCLEINVFQDEIPHHIQLGEYDDFLPTSFIIEPINKK